jgi:cellobiose phosphorylase
MYRLAVESLLGLDRQGERLQIKPCLPLPWPSCRVRYRYLETTYHISLRTVVAGDLASIGATTVSADGLHSPNQVIALVNDRLEHQVEVEVGAMLGATEAPV